MPTFTFSWLDADLPIRDACGLERILRLVTRRSKSNNIYKTRFEIIVFHMLTGMMPQYGRQFGGMKGGMLLRTTDSPHYETPRAI
ncbi:MAG TPA: hypothetical protein PKV98_10445 [Burkholderiaceae bacterium]|nr:hypothetical protein [Burkholderiaceae bacterium]